MAGDSSNLGTVQFDSASRVTAAPVGRVEVKIAETRLRTPYPRSAKAALHPRQAPRVGQNVTALRFSVKALSNASLNGALIGTVKRLNELQRKRAFLTVHRTAVLRTVDPKEHKHA
jgi:hypothetical protein